MSSQKKPHLVLVRGGVSALGPVSRQGLWARFPQTPKPQLIIFVAAKAILIASILYFLAG